MSIFAVRTQLDLTSREAALYSLADSFELMILYMKFGQEAGVSK